jgi:hypothetical protein
VVAEVGGAVDRVSVDTAVPGQQRPQPSAPSRNPEGATVHGNAEHHPSTRRPDEQAAGAAGRERRERTSEARPPVSGNHQREALRKPEKLQPDLIERLEAEWPALAAGALAAQLPSWAAEEPALAGFATPQQLLRHIRASRGDTRAEDAVMTALVRQAGSDPLAARMVLHALMPGLKTLARRILLDADQRDELWSSLLAHCWERIRCYPLERRPRRSRRRHASSGANCATATDSATSCRASRKRRPRSTATSSS